LEIVPVSTSKQACAHVFLSAETCIEGSNVSTYVELRWGTSSDMEATVVDIDCTVGASRMLSALPRMTLPHTCIAQEESCSLSELNYFSYHPWSTLLMLIVLSKLDL
jgi:hypothetical protein